MRAHQTSRKRRRNSTIVPNRTAILLQLAFLFSILKSNHAFLQNWRSKQSSSVQNDTALKLDLQHSDIIWKIRPPKETPLLKFWQWKLKANWQRFQLIMQQQKEPLPRIQCPPGEEQVLLEAFLTKNDEKNQRRKKLIGKFGITCKAGPMAPPIAQTVQKLYDVDVQSASSMGVAAIIFMVVEPEYRGKGVGALALQVIRAIHASGGSHFTILVADDKSRPEQQTLVHWYERNGFSRAPDLQAMMGSPQGEYGITMIAPTTSIQQHGIGNGNLPDDCRIESW